MGEINVNFIQPLNRQFSDRPAQALACTLAQVCIIVIVLLEIGFAFFLERSYHLLKMKNVDGIDELV